MKKIYLVFNPVSGPGDAPQELERIRAKLADEVDLDIGFTTPELSATALTQQAIAEGAEMVIACGGDGTVSEVAAVLMNTDIPLAVIPRGTANAFAAALNLPTDIENACQVILHGTPQQIDCATCNGRPMILLTGIGLEAIAISETPRETKQKFGFFAYLTTAVQQLQNLEGFSATIELGHKQQQFDDVLAITVANLAPNTSILAQGTGVVSGDDGLLDVTILTMAEESQILGVLSASYELFQAALKENPAEHPYITSFRAAQLTIHTDEPKALLVDGELVGETPAEFKTIPAGLWVQMPAPTIATTDEPDSDDWVLAQAA